MRVRFLRESGGLGDSLMVLAAAQQFRDENPDAHIELWTFGRYAQVFEGQETMSGLPVFDKVHPLVTGRRPANAPLDAKRWPYLAEEFDVTFDLWGHEYREEVGARWPLRENRIDSHTRLVGVSPRAPHFMVQRDEYEAAAAALEKVPKPLVWIAPRTLGPYRTWPDELWDEVARELMADGVGVIVGSQGGRPKVRAHAHVGLTSIPRLAAYLYLCDAVLCGDTGDLHMAAAVRTKSVGVFGPASGRLTCRHYPLASWAQGPSTPHCQAPCYMRRERGWNRNRCWTNGCASLRELLPRHVVQLARSALARGGRLSAPPEAESPVELVGETEDVR